MLEKLLIYVIVGVSLVRIGGEDNNILSVIGNDVDILNLTRSLKKKLRSATVVRVEPLGDREQAAASMIYQGQPNYYSNDYTYSQPKYSYYNPPVLSQYPPPPPYYYHDASDPGDSTCSIM